MKRYIILGMILMLAHPAFSLGEKTLIIGGGWGWDTIENFISVQEISSVRPHPVLALMPGSTQSAEKLDLNISYIEGAAGTGYFADRQMRWQVSRPSGVEAVNSILTKSGGKAARFHAGNIPGSQCDLTGNYSIVMNQSRNSIFAPQSRVGDFSFEFWLYPLNLDSGEQILQWSSSLNGGKNEPYIEQRVQCFVLQNRLVWEFKDFFFDSPGKGKMNITLTGSSINPREWSHHLIRFDSGTGLLEYLINGQLEALDYAATGHREGGEVYAPLAGNNGSLTMGGRFSGLVDRFRIYGSCLGDPALSKYSRMGRAQTRTIDLGSVSSKVIKIDAYGGSTGSANWKAVNHYAGNKNLKFADHSEIQIFVRMSSMPYSWDRIPWTPIRSGEEFAESPTGRFLQIAADFYSSGDGETSPYLDEIKVVYKEADLPRPPSMVSAIASDGAVELSWRTGTSANTGGYLVYYGTAPGEYYTMEPIDAGKKTGIRIGGLANGTLYYFAIASYDSISREEGEFSREIAARPLLKSP